MAITEEFERGTIRAMRETQKGGELPLMTIYIYIYIYRLCRGPLGPEEWMLGCLDAWILEACTSIWARLGQPGFPNEAFGIPVQSGTPIYGDSLDSGARGVAACSGPGCCKA